MFLSPGHSPRHLSSPSPSLSSASAAAAAPHGQTLTLDSSSTTTNPRKRGPSVLDEDTYVASLERIIERDFFPDIPKLRDRSDWLQALRSGDPVLIRDAQLKILERRASASALAKTPSTSIRRSATRTPSFFPSPSAAATDNTPSATNPPPTASQEQPNQPDTSLSLDQFLHRYTSEDNASFSKILDKVNRKRRDRVSHFLDGESETPLLEDSKGDRITDGYGTSGQPVSSLDGCKYTAKNLLMYVPTHEVPLTDEELVQRATAATKEIDRANTRFHGKLTEDSKPAKEDTAAAILYTPVPGTTPAGAVWPFADRDAERSRKYDLEDLRKSPNPFYVEAAKKAENGYSYLKTPSPAPGVDESPFMTWGEIEGTPLRLDFEDTPVDISGSSNGPQFRIQQPPSRDLKAHSLSREAARKLRERSKMFQKPLLPSPARRGSASPNMRTLSPAAQKFYRNAIAKSSRSSVDETLRASYRGASPVMGTPKERTSTPKEQMGLTRFSRDGSLGSRSPSAKRGSTPPW